MTVILTAVAFKFMISDALPKVSYNTFFDDWLLVSFGSVFVLTYYFAVAYDEEKFGYAPFMYQRVAIGFFTFVFSLLPTIWIAVGKWRDRKIRLECGNRLQSNGQYCGFQFAD